MRISLIDYGVNSEFFSADWKPAVEASVTFIGGITDRKGVRDLVAVAARPEVAHISFDILGDGPIKPELSAISTPNVRWHGSCSRQEVVEHMSSSWALVMPTHSDTGPTVVKEARVLGLPVITTQEAGASSYVISGRCGHVVPAGNQSSILDAILSVCSNRDSCIKLGRNAWEDQRKQLSPNTTASKFVALYNEVFHSL